MKLVYLTAQKYPSKKVDPFYRKSMAGAFAKLLGEGFSFVVRAPIPSEISSLRPLPVRSPRYFKTFFYFLQFPLFTAREGWNASQVTLFSYDSYLLGVAIFWRRVLCYRYIIVSDWHQLYEDWRDSYLAGGCDLHTTTSKRLKNLLVSRFGVSEEKVRVAYGGVDPMPFEQVRRTPRSELRAQLGLPDGFLVGYVGGFTSVGMPKGLDLMIEALTHLPQEIRMVFVGGSPSELEEYRAFSRERGAFERCHFVPRQPFSKVVEYECALDVLVIPYPDKRHFREYGFPMKVWEYLAAGRPIVYSNLELIAEVLEGRATSFPPEDAPGLARALTEVFEHKEAAESAAAKNPAEVLSYTWEVRAKNIIDFVQR